MGYASHNFAIFIKKEELNSSLAENGMVINCNTVDTRENLNEFKM